MPAAKREQLKLLANRWLKAVFKHHVQRAGKRRQRGDGDLAVVGGEEAVQADLQSRTGNFG
jgi:hypothetical protein